MDNDPTKTTPETAEPSNNFSVPTGPHTTTDNSTAAATDRQDDTPTTGRPQQPARTLRSRARNLLRSARTAHQPGPADNDPSKPPAVRRAMPTAISLAAAATAAAMAWLWRRRVANRRRTRRQRAAQLARRTMARLRTRLPI
ncbi:hypothetical protein GCM10023085_25070 [Actinomadura viridis]|uniref:C4-dicarboxylate-specific signal transduction histidine kinase n=1 Tax=Actinomadura viridis TaxID=58110 RepID=A0A931GJ77_9ACTN|nr:hypothetical protein [Actinomadura viridis]MBG6088877.1 C4-dicarboxylate-specific signal transduction histidine kinase [Actinomadura viridis]